MSTLQINQFFFKEKGEVDLCGMVKAATLN